MDISWPRVAASQFTAYMAMLNLSTVMGNWLAPGLSEALSTDTLFIVIGAANLSLIALLPLIDLGQTRRVLGGDEDPAAQRAAVTHPQETNDAS